MTQPTYIVNTATIGGAGRIATGFDDFGLRITAAGRRAVAALASLAAAAGSRAVTSAPTVLPSERVATASRWTDAAERLARFQRDIVPLLDAAYNFARFLSRDADAAQDIVQETFLRAYRSYDSFQGGDSK